MRLPAHSPLLVLLASAALAACGDDRPLPGASGGPCKGDGTCDEGLVCALGVCGTGRLDGGEQPRADAAVGDAGVAEDAGRTDGGEPDAGSGEDASVDAGSRPDAGGIAYVPPAGCFRAGPTIHQIERRSVIAAENGDVHLALGGDGLYYGYRAAGAPAVDLELVDPHAGPATITLDARGEPVIAYWDRSRRSTPLAAEIEGLKLAWRRGGRWEIATLWAERGRPRATYDDDPAPAFVVDAADRVHLALRIFEGTSPSRLEIATWDGQRLEREPYAGVPGPASHIFGVDVVLDGEGRPMVALDTFSRLWVVRRGEAGWREAELVVEAQPGSSVQWTYFVNHRGRPGFAMRSRATGFRLGVWQETATGWDVVDCGMGSVSTAYQPLVLPDGTVLFGARATDAQRMGFVGIARGAVGCPVEQVAPESEHGGRTTDHPDLTLRLDGLGLAAAGEVRALLEYEEHTGALVLHASDDAGRTFTRMPLFSPREYGLSPAIALRPDGTPVIAAVESIRGALELSTVDPASGEWVTEEVPLGAPGDRCRVASGVIGAVDMVVHEGGDVLVAYTRTCQSTGAQLVISRRAGFGWTQQQVGTGQALIDLELQPDGRPAIVAGNELFEYDGAAWRASRGFTGSANAGVALAYDELGRPVVVTRSGREIMSHRRGADGRWTSDRVDTHGQRADHTTPVSLRIAPSGAWLLAYGRYVDSQAARGSNELRLGERGRSDWTSTLVADLSWPGSYVPLEGHDLALFGEQPVIAYRATNESALKLGRRRSDGRWSVDVVVNDGDTGLYPRVALAGETAHLVYHHAGSGDLCYQTAPLPE